MKRGSNLKLSDISPPKLGQDHYYYGMPLSSGSPTLSMRGSSDLLERKFKQFFKNSTI